MGREDGRVFERVNWKWVSYSSRGREIREAAHMPNRLYRHPISPGPSYFVDPAEQPSSINSGRGKPVVQFVSHPIRNRNRSSIASLADQIDNGPVLFALLEMI
jgi:hypothetical protein